MGAFDAYNEHDALGLAALVKKGEVTASELLDAAIERVDRVNPRVNAVITRMFDEARRTIASGLPKGPFEGVPFLLKDLLSAYAGVRLTSGTRYHAGYVPDHDAELVKRHKRAGLVIFGKTNTPEFGLVPITEPELHGPTHTPWRIGHNSGGSSGGAGAAVASGMVPMAHGGDGGGSIRIPASCCGVFGLKPTRGRTPCGPDMSESWFGFAVEHALTRSVRDSAALLDATTGPWTGNWYAPPAHPTPFLDAVTAKPRKLKIAFTTKPSMPSNVHADCLRAAEEMAKLCEELGHEVVEASPQIDAKEFARDFLTVIGVATAMEPELGVEKVGRRGRREDFETITWISVLLGRKTSALEFGLAMERLKTLSRRVAPFFEAYDVLLTPTLGAPPPKIGELQPKGAEALLQKVIAKGDLGAVLRIPGILEQMAEKVFDFIPFTALANVTGQPSMSIPIHVNDLGLPVGAMFTGRFADEATLFNLAGELERARPWAAKRPAVWAG
jgi:amidase